MTDTGELTPVHQGATAASRRARGAYRVTFNRDLIGCVAFAAVGLAAGTSGMLQTDTIADANILRSDPRQVDVFLVHGSPPAQVDGSLNIAVLCE